MYDFLKLNFNEDWIRRFLYLRSTKFKKLLLNLRILLHSDVVSPSMNNIFSIFRTIPIDDIKVIMIVEEPYKVKELNHTIPLAIPGDLNYLPPALHSIFEELEREYGEEPNDIELKHWLKQGVLPIYTSFTTDTYSDENHRELWREFVVELLDFLSGKGIIFVFLGGDTYDYTRYIDTMLDEFIYGPSPDIDSFKNPSFYRSGIFKKINDKLQLKHNFKINWLKDE